jgi:hypothetical protein
MKRQSLLALVLLLGTTAPRAAAPTIAIDASSPSGTVSPLHGSRQEISHAYDGGLYAELGRMRLRRRGVPGALVTGPRGERAATSR